MMGAVFFLFGWLAVLTGASWALLPFWLAVVGTVFALYTTVGWVVFAFLLMGMVEFRSAWHMGQVAVSIVFCWPMVFWIGAHWK